MRVDQAVVVASALLLVVAVMASMTFFLSSLARWVPGIVILPTAALLLLALLREVALSNPRSASRSAAIDAAVETGARTELAVIAAVLLLPVLSQLLGLVAAVFAFTCGYVSRRAGAGAVYSLLAAASVALFVYAVGSIVVGDRVLHGWLWQQLGLQP
jgi:hypothetical protein